MEKKLMQVLKVLICLLSLAMATLGSENWPYYDRNFEKLDIEAVVNDDNILLGEYNHCFLDKAPCSASVDRIKSLLKEGIVTACAKCSPAQKLIIRRYANVLKTKYPEEFDALWNKYDPERKYIESFYESVGNV